MSIEILLIFGKRLKPKMVSRANSSSYIYIYIHYMGSIWDIYCIYIYTHYIYIYII